MTRRGHLRVVSVHDPVVPSADDEDRRWFQDNPFATFRIRRHVPGENPDPGPAPAGHVIWVKITQVVPGTRYRQLGYALEGALPERFHPEVDEQTHARIAQRAQRGGP